MQSPIESYIASLVKKTVQEWIGNEKSSVDKSRKLIVANWKMNMTVADSIKYFESFSVEEDGVDIVFCPPYTLLYPLNEVFLENNQPLLLGAQDVHWEKSGAYTGEISAQMLREIGCQFVIVGHSERRSMGDTDLEVNRKVKTALGNGLKPIICVGESLEQKELGLTSEVVCNQLFLAWDGVEDISNIIVAYEPIWAIGSGLSATPEQAQAVHEGIRQALINKFGQISLTVPILYGGSVKPGNTRELALMQDIDGFLVGGASLVAKDFTEIVKSFSQEG